MKKICLLLVLSSCFVTAFAQKKLFEKAVERGLTPNGSYLIENTKRSNVTAAEMRDYILNFEKVERRNGEISRRREFFIPYEYIHDMKSRVTTMGFVPGANVEFYILCHFFPGEVKRMEDMKRAVGYEIYRADIQMSSTKETLFYRHDNLYWSGEVKNGLISGSGVGVYFDRKRNCYYVLSGNYKYGLPVGNNKRYYGYIDDYKYIKYSKKVKDLEKFEYGNIKDQYKTYFVDEKEVNHDPIADKALQLVANEQYYIDSEKIEEAYGYVKNINSENYKNLILKEDVVHGFANYWSGKNFDPKGMLALAKEISDVYTVIKALSIGLKSRYHVYSSSLGVFWSHYDHNAILQSAVNIIKAGKEGSKYGFNNFYRQVEDAVVSKFNRFIDQMKKENAEVVQRISDDERDLATYREEMCEDCKMDASKSTFPEGYVPKSSFLFGSTPAHSEKEGKIVLKNGDWVSWKYVYGDNVKYIEAEGSGYGRYDTVAEMIEDILKKCKERYCK